MNVKHNKYLIQNAISVPISSDITRLTSVKKWRENSRESHIIYIKKNNISIKTLIYFLVPSTYKNGKSHKKFRFH